MSDALTVKLYKETLTAQDMTMSIVLFAADNQSATSVVMINLGPTNDSHTTLLGATYRRVSFLFLLQKEEMRDNAKLDIAVDICPECQWKFFNKQIIEVRKKRTEKKGVFMICIHKSLV